MEGMALEGAGRGEVEEVACRGRRHVCMSDQMASTACTRCELRFALPPLLLCQVETKVAQSNKFAEEVGVEKEKVRAFCGRLR